MPRNNSTTITQIHRFLALIEYAAARESVDVEELALAGGVSRASIYRILHEMREALGASIVAGADGRYRLESAGVVKVTGERDGKSGGG